MSGPSDADLAVRREELRARLREQRRTIAALLEPPRRSSGLFPRSALMRALTGHPGLATTIAAAVAGLVLRGRGPLLVSAVLLGLRVVRKPA